MVAERRRPGRARAASDRACAERALDEGEQLVSVGEGVFRSIREERRGLVVLTDQRVMCIDRGVQHGQPLELPLSGITSVESGDGRTLGDSKRGHLIIESGALKTHVTRIRPWECAATIASYVQSARGKTGAAR